jgi:hypothetical protein
MNKRTNDAGDHKNIGEYLQWVSQQAVSKIYLSSVQTRAITMQQSLASTGNLRWCRAYSRKQTAVKGSIMKRTLIAMTVFCAGIVMGKAYILHALQVEVKSVSGCVRVKL